VGGGRITTLGPPTGVFVDAAGDASGYPWIANGCARGAAITGRGQSCSLPPAAHAPSPHRLYFH
jgi:hypothetical protein